MCRKQDPKKKLKKNGRCYRDHSVDLSINIPYIFHRSFKKKAGFPETDLVVPSKAQNLFKKEIDPIP